MVELPRVSLNLDLRDGLCFGCGQNNPIGLKLTFAKEGHRLKAEFVPGKNHQGWPGVVHGGILTCLLDEAMNWAAFHEGLRCLTARIEARLRRPVKIEEPLVITAWVTKKTRRLVDTIARVCLKDGTVVAESTARQFVVESEAALG